MLKSIFGIESKDEEKKRIEKLEKEDRLRKECSSGNIEKVKILLHGIKNFNINARDPNNPDNWALYNAIKDDNLEIADLLLQNKSDPNLKTSSGRTLLHTASTQGNLKLIQLLLTHTAHVNTQDNDGWTALHQAVYCKNVEVVKLLLERNADYTIKSIKDYISNNISFPANSVHTYRYS